MIYIPNERTGGCMSSREGPMQVLADHVEPQRGPQCFSQPHCTQQSCQLSCNPGRGSCQGDGACCCHA